MIHLWNERMKKAIENQSLIVAAIVKNNNYRFRQHNIEFTEYVCVVAIALKKRFETKLKVALIAQYLCSVFERKRCKCMHENMKWILSLY